MATKTKPLATFKPEPWQIQALNDTSPVLLLGGSAGGGKSRCAAEKVHAFCLTYPDATAVILRKKRDDMDASVINFMKETVIDLDNEPRCTFKAREDRIVYHHPNDKKSEIIFMGLHGQSQREALKSIGMKGAVDMIWMEEATEFDESDFNYVRSRMRGTAAGWYQIILTTNPGGRLHWINRRLILGEEATYIPSRARDNPYNPSTYQNDLESMTGVDKLRLAYGQWVDGIGMVIDTWLDDHSARADSHVGNVTYDADYVRGDGPIVWFADDGYSGEKDDKTGFFTAKSNPRVFLICQKRRDGTLAVLDESLEVMMLESVHIDKVLKRTRSINLPDPVWVVYDGAAPHLGAEIKKAGLKPKGVRTKIKDGNDELRAWVGMDRNKRRRVIVHPRCKYLRWEMGSYVNDDSGNPIDAHNHTIDALTYGVWHLAHGSAQEVEVLAPGITRDEMDQMRIRIAEEIAKVREAIAKEMQNAW